MERLIYERIRALETDHWWFVARRGILRRLIARIGVPAGARILEVGCGAGGNVPLLREFGTVSAIEPDQDSREYAADRLGQPVEHGLLPDGLPFAPETFDLVCAFDVVEHVDDDEGAVMALARLAKPGGAILTTAPAYQWMWSHHDVLHHHKRRYRLPAYRALFEQAGLEIEAATYFNTLLFVPAAVQRLIKRLLGDQSADDAMPPAWLNKALTTVFALEGPLATGTGLPFGMSIAVVARKKA
uniref:class I SAM-dependent methyltransferase n=1 Tax=uncultured Caulobacter sp. TaxID=158749 RepID=UPI0025D0A7BE|nr:class I SAM-dependent methyltransferase [uncultured Caulobacter sp.]